VNVISRKQAKEQGLTRYFTGDPCKHGHIAERMVSNHTCVICVEVNKRRYRAKHPERGKNYSKQYNSDHKEQIIAYGKRYRAQNAEVLKQRWKTWYEANKDWWVRHNYINNQEAILERSKRYGANNPKEIRARNKKYYHANKEKEATRTRKYRKDNPGIINALCMKRHTDKLKRTPAWADLDAIKTVYQSAQALTKITGITYSVDHIIPLRGKLVSGLHVESNLQLMPLSGNINKSNRFNPLNQETA